MPRQAREFALAAIDRALAGVAGTTALHTCFGYAARRPRQAGRLPVPRRAGRLRRRPASPIEAAQPRLDPSVLEPIAGKTIVARRARPVDDDAVETPDDVAARIEAALEVVPPERLQVGPDCGMKYLPREVAFAKLARWSRAPRGCAPGSRAPGSPAP